MFADGGTDASAEEQPRRPASDKTGLSVLVDSVGAVPSTLHEILVEMFRHRPALARRAARRTQIGR